MTITQENTRDHSSSPEASTGRAKPRDNRWLSLASIALAVALVIMDATVANVALPVVIRDLGLRSTDAQWMNAVYSLVFAAFIITAGRLGDVFGRRKIAIGGLVLFLLASVGAGAAQGAMSLIAARIVQGLGAAAVLPATLSTINTFFRGRDRSIAFAVYGSMIGGMAAVGPLVGGWLATSHSWRWAFWLNIPFGLIALLGMLRFTPSSSDPNAHRSLGAFDIPGVGLISVALGSLVFGLIESSSLGWPIVAPIIGVGLALSTVFVFYERHRRNQGKAVLVDMRLLSIRTLRLGISTAFLVSLGEFGLIFVLPLLLQGAMGYDALGTGWLMMALAAGTFIASGLVPHLVTSLGKRGVIILGLGLEAIAVAALAWMLPASGWWMALALGMYGFGIGLANAQLTDMTMQDVPVELSGMASGLQTTVRQLGSALGVAGLGGLLINSLTTNVSERFAAAGLQHASEVATAVHDSAGAAIPAIVRSFPQAAEPAISSLMDSSVLTIAAASAVLAVAFVASYRLPRKTGSIKPNAPKKN